MGEETDAAAEDSNHQAFIKRRIQPSSETAEYDFLEIIAELEDADIDELPSLYHEVEHLVETLFRTPPSKESQLEVSFSYAGYRATINQRGDVALIPVKESMGGEESAR